jgi:hypothetical protein
MPISIPTALLIGAGVSGGASLASGIIGSSAASSAANKEVTAAQQAEQTLQTAGQTANSTLQGVEQSQLAGYSPYVQAGTAGLTNLTAALAPGGSLSQQFSFNPSTVSQDPAYQFQLQQGLQAVQRAAAAGGTLNSGGTLKALTQYGQGVAASYENQDYTQALNTYNTNRSTNLGNIQTQLNAGTYGQNGTSSALQNYGNLFSSNTLGVGSAIANQQTNIGNEQAAGIIGGANAWSGALGGIAGAANAYVGGTAQLQQLQQLLGALNGGSGGAGNSTNVPAGASGPYSGNNPGGYLPSAAPSVVQTAPSAFNLAGYGGSPVNTSYGAPGVGY